MGRLCQYCQCYAIIIKKQCYLNFLLVSLRFFYNIKIMLYRAISPLVYQAKLGIRGLYRASFDCDGCQKKIKNPECNACEKMINYFNVFSIPEKYEIDTYKISEKAKQLQKQFHPDKNISSGHGDKSVEYSAYINHAKSTLLDDLKRAVYLMQIKGINIEDEGNIQDSQFMADIFELQEQIEEATPAQAEQITKRIQGVLSELKGNLKKFFESDDIEKCKQFVFKYKYLHRALQNSKDKLEKLARRSF